MNTNRDDLILFAQAIVNRGRCNSVNAVLSEYDEFNDSFYYYKSEYAFFKEILKLQKTEEAGWSNCSAACARLQTERSALKAQQSHPDFRPQLSKLVNACQRYLDADGCECFPEEALLEATVSLEKDAHNASVRYGALKAQQVVNDADKHSTYPAPRPAPVVPEGYVLVPVEPTPEMVSAQPLRGITSTLSVAIYKSMLAAHDKQRGGE